MLNISAAFEHVDNEREGFDFFATDGWLNFSIVFECAAAGGRLHDF